MAHIMWTEVAGIFPPNLEVLGYIFPLIFRILGIFRDSDPRLFGENPMGFKILGIGIFTWDGLSHEKATSGMSHTVCGCRILFS